MEKFIDIDGTRIWTIAEGIGTPLLLCNGGPGCDDYLKPVSLLVEDICRVTRFEPRGCGRSDYDGQYGLDQTVADMEAIRTAYGVDQWIIAGHSAGPDLALAYALEYPDRVIGIIGIAGGRIVNDRDWSAAYHRNQEDRGEDWGGKVFTADPQVNKMGTKSWRDYLKRPDLLRAISTMEIPAVFINAGEDIRPNWPTRQLAALIPAGEYHEISGAAHYIWLTHANELGAIMKNAVARMIGV